MKIVFKRDDKDISIVNGDNFISIVPSFDCDEDLLKFFEGQDFKRIIKKKSKQTYEDKKNNKVRHYYNYFVEFDNGTRVQIRSTHRNVLDGISVYEG